MWVYIYVYSLCAPISSVALMGSPPSSPACGGVPGLGTGLWWVTARGAFPPRVSVFKENHLRALLSLVKSGAARFGGAGGAPFSRTRASGPSPAVSGQIRFFRFWPLGGGSPPPHVSLPPRLASSSSPRFWADRPAGRRQARTPLLAFRGRLRPLGLYCALESTPRVCQVCLSPFRPAGLSDGNVRGRAGDANVFAQVFLGSAFFRAGRRPPMLLPVGPLSVFPPPIGACRPISFDFFRLLHLAPRAAPPFAFAIDAVRLPYWFCAFSAVSGRFGPERARRRTLFAKVFLAALVFFAAGCARAAFRFASVSVFWPAPPPERLWAEKSWQNFRESFVLVDRWIFAPPRRFSALLRPRGWAPWPRRLRAKRRLAKISREFCPCRTPDFAVPRRAIYGFFPAARMGASSSFLSGSSWLRWPAHSAPQEKRGSGG